MALMPTSRVAPIALDRERVKCLLLINTQLMKKALKVYNNQSTLSSLEQLQRQQVVELYQNCTKRLQCNLAVLSYIYDKYHESSNPLLQNAFPYILSPPQDMPELHQLYQKLQELYPEAVQFLKMKLQQWKRAQQEKQDGPQPLQTPQQQLHQVPLQQHSPPPSLTGRASQQQQQQQQQQHQQHQPQQQHLVPPAISSPQIIGQMPSSVQRQMGGQMSQQHTPVMANSPLANSMYKNNVSNTPGYMQHQPLKQLQQPSQQQLPMAQNATFNQNNMNPQSFKHVNQQPPLNQSIPARRSVSSAQNTPMSTMLPQQILQQANSMTPSNEGFGATEDNFGMGMGFLNFNSNEGLDMMSGIQSNNGGGGMFGDNSNSVNTMLLMNTNAMGDMNMNLMANGSMMD